MHTKRIAIIAIIAALPFTAMAENISGAMYTAPTTATQQNPAPTTNSSAPYGRVNIDTDDQSHIATTAYVKGAYNSAIAGLNRLAVDKQMALYVETDDDEYDITDIVQDSIDKVNIPNSLVTGMAVKNAIDSVNSTVNDLNDTVENLVDYVANDITPRIDNKRVEIYTTWDTNDKTQVAFVNASSQSGQ